MPRQELRDTEILRMRVSVQLKKSLQDHAERLGVPLGTLCMFVLGSWVDAQRRVVEPMNDEVRKAIEGAMRHLFKLAAEGQIESLALLADNQAEEGTPVKGEERALPASLDLGALVGFSGGQAGKG